MTLLTGMIEFGVLGKTTMLNLEKLIPFIGTNVGLVSFNFFSPFVAEKQDILLKFISSIASSSINLF